MTATPTASAGAIGGASNEAGSELRARVGALLASTVILGSPLESVGLAIPGATGRLLAAESDAAVDDLEVTLTDDRRVYVQVKIEAGLGLRAGSPLDSAVEQFARAVRRGLEPADRVVLACARPVSGLKALGTLLDRNRLPASGSPTTKEAQALATLRTIASRYLDESEIEVLLDRLVIWTTDPTCGDGSTALISRLDGNVCREGHGLDAARELSDVVRTLARVRGGLDKVGLVRALDVRDVPLTPDADPGSAVAWVRALTSYRERQARIGSTLSLFGAPPDMADLPLDDADAQIEVDVPGEDRGMGRDLALALRRRGRAVLVGSPGGGKSTALRAAAAHWAARADWPTPIVVHLQRVADSRNGITNAVLDATCEDLPGPGRTTLRDALEHELAAGRCLLAFDGLDEVRPGRTAMVAELSIWLSTLPPGVEVVVATRPVASTDGKRLRLPELTLRPPGNPDATVYAILAAAAPDDAGGDSWVEDRRRWVDDVIRRDPSLGATPLTVVTLALIAAKSGDPAELPRTRALILRRALEDAVETWEVESRNRGRVTLGPLTQTRARDAIAVSLRVLSSAALIGKALSESEVRTQIGERLNREFDLHPGDARSAAHDALQFWVDAGLFSFEDDRLAATLRPLAEVGVAWEASLMDDDEQEQWVDRMRLTPELWASLELGAGLSRHIAYAWSRSVADGGGVDELIAVADAARDGAQFEPDDFAAILTRRAPTLLSDPVHAERAAEAILSLPLTPDLRAEVRPLLSRAVPAERRLLIEALAITTWDEQGADLDDLLRTFVAAPAPPRPGHLERETEPEPNVLLLLEPDGAYFAAFEAAAVRLAGLSRSDAELVIDRFEDGSIGFRSELQHTLRAAGHQDLADRVNADLEAGWARQRELFEGFDFEGTERRLLGLVTDLAAPADLDPLQARRLDDLADFVASANLQWIRSGWPDRQPEVAAAWISAVCELGGFDAATLSAQAQIVLDEMDAGEGTDRLLYDEGHERELSNWSSVAAPARTLTSVIEAIGLVPRQAAGQLQRAILSAADRALAVSLLEARLTQVRRWARLLAAHFLLVCVSVVDADARARTWLDDDDPVLRAAAASWWSRRTASGEPMSAEIDRAMGDADEGVRAAALQYLEPEDLTSQQRDRLLALREDERQPWRCRQCGADNPAAPQFGCKKCSTSGPSVVRAIDDLLGTAASTQMAPRPRPRRIRRD